ncbi:hypothetical protein VD0002_g5871 [Verticillium dahliae]|uniref:Uncharacterized protein n=2 Tax=Verticillium TaxID=1036719 RepID=A0AA44WAZ9_VERDA|nr:Putative metal ion transporter C27B12.12c [Verticillium dahliae VDG2]KAH6691869.1 hypothetical protein EV126DRAFT_390652 [Verticillium dahliae]PNH27460.1 hypothetical protein BJF96_g9210 [Verticillium dahliae]PNH57072.1 hypothetical protein VD0003_g771 [Verticillium dahliae]PNH62071.1 hypothetical protein VD0002_g5871 [Verticillium dahliae]
MPDFSDKDAFIHALKSYYTTLSSSGLFALETIRDPPAGGWPLAALSVPPTRSKAAISLLRHIPYLEPYAAPDGQTSQWPILVKALAINYLEPLRKDYPDLPPDVIVLARASSVDPSRCDEIVDCTLNCATGEVTSSNETVSATEFFEMRIGELKDQTVMPLPPVDDMAPALFSDEWGRDDIVKRALRDVQIRCGWTGTHNILVWNRAKFLREMAWFRRRRRRIEECRAAREEMFDDEADEDWPPEDTSGASSESEGTSNESDLEDKGGADDMTNELAGLWSDLDEAEFDHVSEQLAKDNISHAFQAPRKGQAPVRLAVPAPAAQNEATAARDALVDGLTRYYTLLTRAAYLPAEAVDYPPPEGWQTPLFQEDKLRAVKYDDETIEVLRHLPYIREAGEMEDQQWQVFARGYPIRYLHDGHLLQQSPSKLAKKKLQDLGFSPYKAALPGTLFAVVKARTESDSHWWLVDLEKGEIMVDNATTQVDRGSTKTTPWLRNKAEPISSFFDKLVHRLVTLDLVPMPDLGRLEGMYDEDVYGPEIWGGIAAREEENVRGALDLEIELARKIYLENGWPTHEFRRQECIDALVQMRQQMWQHVRDERQNLYEAEYADKMLEEEVDDEYHDDVDEAAE